MANFEKGTSRLGIDVGNVISDHHDNDDDGDAYYGDMADAMAQRSPTLECAYAVRALVQHFGSSNTFILSKCRTRMQLATVRMLSNPIRSMMEPGEAQSFLEITGLIPRNVTFCTKASGGSDKKQKLRLLPLHKENTSGPRVAEGDVGKGAVARALGLTHMIDDRKDCLLSFALEGHLLSQTQLRRSARSKAPQQRGYLLQFYKQEAPAPAIPTDIERFLVSHNLVQVTQQTKKQIAAMERWLLPMWKQVQGWQEVLQTFEITPHVPDNLAKEEETEEDSSIVPADKLENDRPIQ